MCTEKMRGWGSEDGCDTVEIYVPGDTKYGKHARAHTAFEYPTQHQVNNIKRMDKKIPLSTFTVST